jgi:hypothetical protein
MIQPPQEKMQDSNSDKTKTQPAQAIHSSMEITPTTTKDEFKNIPSPQLQHSQSPSTTPAVNPRKRKHQFDDTHSINPLKKQRKLIDLDAMKQMEEDAQFIDDLVSKKIFRNDFNDFQRNIPSMPLVSTQERLSPLIPQKNENLINSPKVTLENDDIEMNAQGEVFNEDIVENKITVLSECIDQLVEVMEKRGISQEVLRYLRGALGEEDLLYDTDVMYDIYNYELEDIKNACLTIASNHFSFFEDPDEALDRLENEIDDIIDRYQPPTPNPY